MAGKIAPIGVMHLQGHFIQKYVIELLKRVSEKQ